MPVAAPHRPPPLSTAAAAVTLALVAGSGCSGSGTPVAGLPVLRPMSVMQSSQAAGAPGRGGPVGAATRVVRRYYVVLDGLRRRMRAAPLARLLTSDCPCRVQVGAVRAAARRGERFTDHVRVVTLFAHLDTPDLVDVVVSLDVSRAGRVDGSGRIVPASSTLRDVHRELILRRTGGRWLIARVMAV